MPNKAAVAIHATAVSIAGAGLIIKGASKSGKSTLALALIAASTSERPIRLIGDDRVLLTSTAGDLRVAPHPRIAGLIEKRGHGILSMPYDSAIPVMAVVELSQAPNEGSEAKSPFGTCDLLGKNFPSLFFVNESRWDGRCGAVLEWFSATSVAHCRAKMAMT